MNLKEQKKLNKIISTIDKIASLYQFIKVFDINELDYKCYQIDSNKIIISSTYKYDYESIEGVSFVQAIFRAFGLSLNLLSNSNNLYYNKIKMFIDNLNYIDDKNQDILLNILGINLGKINYLENKITIEIELIKFVKLIDEKGKNLNINEKLHLVLITNDKYKTECYKALNVCRIGGLQAIMVYDDFIDFNSFETRFVVEINDELMKSNLVNIIDTYQDINEEISIFDIYPYIINKINKQSKCSTCKEV